MTTEIAKPVSNTPATLIPSFAPAPAADEKTFEALSSGGKWLPRLTLYGSNSDAAKEGLITMGTYGMTIGKTITPLNKEVDVLVISWRPTALDMRSDDTVVSSHNPADPLFQQIAKKAEDESDSGCMYGAEFLLYIPVIQKYVTYLMGSKSARREAPRLKAKMSQAATLKVDLASNKKYKWHVPVVTACSTPFKIPPIEELKEKAVAFNNPPQEAEKEKIEPPAAGKDKRAR